MPPPTSNPPVLMWWLGGEAAALAVTAYWLGQQLGVERPVQAAGQDTSLCPPPPLPCSPTVDPPEQQTDPVSPLLGSVVESLAAVVDGERGQRTAAFHLPLQER